MTDTDPVPRDAYRDWYAWLAARLDAYAGVSARKAAAAARSAALIRAELEARR